MFLNTCLNNQTRSRSSNTSRQVVLKTCSSCTSGAMVQILKLIFAQRYKLSLVEFQGALKGACNAN